MIDKILKWATPILLLVIMLRSFSGGGSFLGTADTTTRFTDLDVTGAITVDDTTVIEADRGLRAPSSTITSITVTTSTFGAGTAIGKIACNGTQYDPPSLAQLATTSVSMTLTGALANGSTSQVYWVGFASSTPNFQWVANASGTDAVNVTVENNGTTQNAGTAQLSVCMLQF